MSEYIRGVIDDLRNRLDSYANTPTGEGRLSLLIFAAEVLGYESSAYNHIEATTLDILDRATKPISMLDDIEAEVESNIGKFTAWELEFIESVRDQVNTKRALSYKQRDCLALIYERRVLGW